jgi:ring-1,2-phenylacetyl-CoA epoxidase subunit PaaD
MDATTLPGTDEVWRWLAQVPDPEIPVISLTDLGIIRDVAWEGDTLDIEAALKAHGIGKLRLERRLSPAWTTDWISTEGRDKLRAYGIAPPIDGTAADGRLMARASRLAGSNLAIACPRCGSTNTEKVSQFGSTPCKASYRCTDCLEPFDYFKCI